MDFGYLERVEDVHGNSIGPLVVKVASDATPEALVGLAYVDGFAIVIVEGADPLAVVVWGLKERFNFLADQDDVRRGS